jgi:hypothetical protein
MNVEFFDRQDERNPLNGLRISETARLIELLDQLQVQLQRRTPFFYELIGKMGMRFWSVSMETVAAFNTAGLMAVLHTLWLFLPLLSNQKASSSSLSEGQRRQSHHATICPLMPCIRSPRISK